MQLHVNYLLTSGRLLGRLQKSFGDDGDANHYLLKAARSSPTLSLSPALATFAYRLPPTWRLASANCCWLKSKSPRGYPYEGARHLANPLRSQASGRRLGKAANWASVRVPGEAGAVGRRRGSEEPFGASAPHSHLSPAPWAFGAQALRRLFVK